MSIETKIEMFGNPSSEFFFAGDELQDLLNDKNRQPADYWDFHSAGLEALTRKLSRLFAVSNGGFTFQATWSGVDAAKTESLTYGEFIEIVKSNKVDSSTKYIVVGA